MKRASRKDWWVVLIIWASNILCLLVAIQIGWDGLDRILINLIIISFGAFLFSVLYGTYYEILSSELVYRTGPIYGKIAIKSIREIIVGKTLYVGLIKPALASKGLIIKYNKYDELYISPDSNKLFVEEILNLNPDIKVHYEA